MEALVGGAAFFVPYFLKKLDSFLPNLSATTAEGKTKDLIIYLMDPVSGSRNEEDPTAASLKMLGLDDKTDLIQTLKNKGFKLKLIFLSAGFDMRLTFFKLDRSFYDKRDLFDYAFTAKLGLTHANMSSWSVPYGSERSSLGERVLKTLVYGKIKSNVGYTLTNDETYPAFHQVLSDCNPDKDITQKMMLFLSKKPSSPEVLNATIKQFHESTEQYLGNEAALASKGVYYFVDYASAALTNFTPKPLSQHSRLGIEQLGTLDALQSK